MGISKRAVGCQCCGPATPHHVCINVSGCAEYAGGTADAVADAAVTLTDGTGTVVASGTTDSTGQVCFDVVAGTYTRTVTASGYQTATTTAVYGATDTTENVTLTPTVGDHCCPGAYPLPDTLNIDATCVVVGGTTFDCANCITTSSTISYAGTSVTPYKWVGTFTSREYSFGCSGVNPLLPGPPFSLTKKEPGGTLQDYTLSSYSLNPFTATFTGVGYFGGLTCTDTVVISE